MSKSFFALICALLLATFRPSLADATTTHRFVSATVALNNPNVRYDSGYHRIPYPSGDVPKTTGVCADVVIRAYRGIGVDLQKLVHEDMAHHFSVYPKIWGMTHPDTNIDHRRVPNLAVFFTRHGKVLSITSRSRDYAAGDIVVWNLRKGGSLPHIGIVTDRQSADGARPLVMHNVGGGQVLEDVLFAYDITGHFRYGLD
jgi:uncharacterized protein YijF (DUF1287 family)